MVVRSPSSSSSSSSSSNIDGFSSYDVFLSFRGKDTRKAFTDHLYTTLKQDGINTFRDDDAMERGRVLKPELEKAIHQSQISLIVFSKGYATSKWCLDELLMIMERHKRSSTNKHEVVPVFYHIDPTHVRNQTGCFEEAFNGYDDQVTRETDAPKKRELSKKIEAWRSSLRKAGSLTGMVLGEDGYEAKFISSIVKVIRKKLNYNSLYIDEKLVGIEEYIAKIESWLQDPSPNAVIFVIDGIGGIGKTTIAKCVYNSNFCDYDCSCFLADINEVSSKPNGMCDLQSQLLSKILNSGKKENVWNEYEGTTKITDSMCNKTILLVLDDVTTSQQLNALLGPQRFYPGSKVLVTTRHKWLITDFKVCPVRQTIKTLSADKSIKLFSLHAFGQNQPNEAYVAQSKLVDHYCKGLPLALKVLGHYLRGKNINEWEDAMCTLEANPHPEIQNVLRLSYESLEFENDKDVFLHIACFFVGEDKDYIVKLLAGCNLYPIIGIKNLNDRSLLYFENGKVGMHPLVREMGREVVRLESPKEPGKRSRLCQREDCINVLQDNVGTKKVEGFWLQRDDELLSAMSRNETNFQIRSLEKMKNLMLLQLNYATFSGKYKKLPKKLRLLTWHGFSLKSIPDDISLEKLVVLDMSYSKLERVWDDFKFIGSLKILNLSYCVALIKTPDFGGLLGVERLILKGCTSLITVDESIAYLRKLVLLDVTDCRSLRNVPFFPRSLVTLQISGCPNLAAVEGLQSSILSLSLLVKLNISNCNLFDNSFANDWSNLVSLNELRMDRNNVTYLPKCIQTLPRIQILEARGCSYIKSVLGSRKTLTSLGIKYNKSLCSASLKVLNLSYSVELFRTSHFGALPRLESLIVRGCTSLTKIDESIAYLEGLVSLDLTDCLRNVPCLPRSLESFKLRSFPTIGVVQDVQRVKFFSLTHCLVKLNISNCNLFDNSFPNDWSNLVSLNELRMDRNNVTYLPKCIQTLPRLECLEANRCSHIQSILGLPKTLISLYITNNTSLVKVQLPLESSVSMAALEKQSIFVTSNGCPNLCCMEGCFKWQSMDKVERKIIQNLGLGTELSVDCYSDKQKVLFEYGIFSTYVTEEQIPLNFMHKEKGPLISFFVPSSQNRIISGFNLSLVFSQAKVSPY